MNLGYYKTLVFDCDGVVLDANKVKTRAFYKAALPYGEKVAQALVDYHVAHGGISRYRKFEFFLEHILSKVDFDKSELSALLVAFANEVWKGLITCNIAEGLSDLKEKTAGSRWLVVSGGDQAELRRVFDMRDIARFFDGGIFGSPDSKDEIIKREMNRKNIVGPTLFLGDSKYDYMVARNAGLDFVFVSGWSEVKNWKQFCSMKNITAIEHIGQI